MKNNPTTLTLSHEKKARRIATLLAGYMSDALSPSERDELDEWVGASDKNMRLFEELTDERRVTLALQLLNDEEGLAKKLKDDKGYTFPNRSRISIGFMSGVMTAIGVYGVIELIKLF